VADVSEGSGVNFTDGGTVAGYFARGEDARCAVDALIGKGFDAREIGAAFHSRLRESAARAEEDEPMRRTSASDHSFAGVASGTEGVTPSGLSTGGGTGISGAHRPGPISGSEIPQDLPTEIPHELPTDAEVRAMKSGRSMPNAALPVSTPNQDERIWRARLETVFGRESGTGRPVESRKPETGGGHLGDIADYAYSSSAFEQSFAGMGIPLEQAQRMAQELQRGGAVVTVKAGARAAEAESEMLRNHGVIRYGAPTERRESGSGRDNADLRVEVFGEVRRVYPNYAPPERQIARKAS